MGNFGGTTERMDCFEQESLKLKMQLVQQNT